MLSETVIRERLQQNPIPLPEKTPFDDNAEKRQAYLEGFSKARDVVVSGAFLHGTFGFSMPQGLEDPWKAGWKDGNKIAIDRWKQEDEKLRNENRGQGTVNRKP